MAAGSSDDEEDEDYNLNETTSETNTGRYPVHDCVEFENAEALKKLIFVIEQPESDDSHNEDDHDSTNEHIDEEDHNIDEASATSSSSDENDSAAAAHAAAIGHSPQPIPCVTSPGSATSSKSTSVTAKDDQDIDCLNRSDPVEEKKDISEDQKETVGSIHDVSTNPDSSEAPIDEKETKDETDTEHERQRKFPGSRKLVEKVKYYCPYNLNERDEDENTALHVAIHCRKLEHVRILIEAGASLHRKCDGSPPLHVAISMGAIPQHVDFAYDCVKLLHENEADFAGKDDSSHTALYLACMYNLPKVVTFILSTETGLSTLNFKGDRTQGRALHAAAKFDTITNVNVHRAPKINANLSEDDSSFHTNAENNPSEKTITQILIESKGIELNAQNTVGQTPLHVACARGNWNVVRLLLNAGANPDIADKRGFTPGQYAHKRGMLIPNDVSFNLGGPPSSGLIPPPRDLIVDPDNNTLLITHELCGLHRTCPPIRRDSSTEPPPENVRRLHVLVDKETGILRSGEFDRCNFENEGRRAALVDILKCHEYSYVEKISQMCSSIPDHPMAVAHLDADTTMSRWSFESALRAAGSVCEAVDKVISGDHRNAFCVVRPPGHHAGPRGIVRCENDRDGGSHGFCFLNNVAIGAAYARSMYRNEGISKIAIVDFDVHHGNGTEEIIRQLVPTVEKSVIRTPFAVGELGTKRYMPWLDETDIHNVFFASAHGYGPRGLEFANNPSGGWFYPASGKSSISDAINNPSMVETPNMTDFLFSQTWTRMGNDARDNCCKILNCGLSLPGHDVIPGMQRLEVRDTYRKKILPSIRKFDPDIIFVSAGFDAHKKDSMNFGYVGMVEDDYEWVTEQLVRIANTCCNGRIVSVLEGGYKIHGGIVSPFARSVASHVRALEDGGRSRELYDFREGEWESQFERHLIDEKERKRQQKLEKIRILEERSHQALHAEENGTEGGYGAYSSRKRKRNPVDYKQLYENMKKEGFAA